MDSFPLARNALKIPIKARPCLASPLSVKNGIEKVRGSTPLISTIRFVCKNKRSGAFLVFAPFHPKGCVSGVLIHFNTLRRALCPTWGGKCAAHETETERVASG